MTPDAQEVTASFRRGVPVEGSVEKLDGSPAAFAFVAIEEDGKRVRTALADADGRFVAILDPDFKGLAQLRCEASADGGKQVFSAVVEVQPGQAPVTLRLEPKK